MCIRDSNAPTGTQNTYDIDWSGSAKESNYKVEADIGTLMVTEYDKPIVVTTVGGIFTYNGEPHGADVTVSDLPAGYWKETAASSASATDVTASPVAATADKLVIRNAPGLSLIHIFGIELRNGELGAFEGGPARGAFRRFAGGRAGAGAARDRAAIEAVASRQRGQRGSEQKRERGCRGAAQRRRRADPACAGTFHGRSFVFGFGRAQRDRQDPGMCSL